MENNQVTVQQNEKLSIGGWMLTILVLMIPLVNIIMLFVWGFGGEKTGRKNFCIATLIWAAIGIVLYIIIIVIFGAALFSFANFFY
ncbi:MAG: hypothetical protein KAQ68_04250 [Clostridiales bacterium]|nr:hypothetical protein [Clostridiales bacterium]